MLPPPLALASAVGTALLTCRASPAAAAALQPPEPSSWTLTGGSGLCTACSPGPAGVGAPQARQATYARYGSISQSRRRVRPLHLCRHTTINTWWNAGHPDPIVTPAFDTDGNPASFNLTEQRAIVAIWRAVAEDYAPFDIDVS